MRKLYEILKVLKIQKMVVSAETIRRSMVSVENIHKFFRADLSSLDSFSLIFYTYSYSSSQKIRRRKNGPKNIVK